MFNDTSINTTNSTSNQSENTSKKQGYDFSPVYSQDGKLIVYFFHAPHCHACQSIAPKVEDIGYRYQKWTEWRGFNINIDKDRVVYFQFSRDFNLTPERSGTPMILVNRTILWGQYEINDSLEQIINGSIRR
jgi:thiol-disulfide isomerase/thioredoxin